MARDLTEWRPEDNEFWEKTGKKVAYRNLIISISCLLLAFTIWLSWSVIIIQMINLNFNFKPSELFGLVAIGGFAGATLRIPSTFMISIAGGRNTIFLTSLLLLIPTIGAGIALMNPNTPLWVFEVYALIGGIAGGNFSSSMSNISFFFPQRVQGTSLGLNAGLGNAGVTTTQVVLPLIFMVSFIGPELELKIPSKTLIGALEIGTKISIQNGMFIWAILLVPACLFAWFGMNNITTKDVSPHVKSTVQAFGKIIVLILLGLITSAIGIKANEYLPWYIVLPAIIALTVALVGVLPWEIGSKVRSQYGILKQSHTWYLTILYTMAFGSFIGFSGAFGMSIKIIFGFQHALQDGNIVNLGVNPNAPSAITYAWLGPLIGALIRPVGGAISDKLGGSLVTAVSTTIMIICSFGVTYYMREAYHSQTPEIYFTGFLTSFLLLFFATGIGTGSVFKSGSTIFQGPEKGPVLGWIAAVAAYGAFIIPQIIKEQIKVGTPEKAMIGLSIFYIACLFLVIVVYLRPGAKHKNP